MHRIFFIFFISLFLSVFYLLNRYVVSRLNFAIPDYPQLNILKTLYWSLFSTFFIGQFLERLQPHLITKIISGIGSFWLAWFMYIVLTVLFIDFIRLLNHYINFIPKGLFNGLFLVLSVLLLTLSTVIYGYFNARNATVKHVHINIKKTMVQPIKIALVSDLHIGAIVSNGKIKKMVEMINKEKPDLVLIAGDLVDHNPLFAIKDQVGNQFDQIQAPMGIYAITGNHEYIGDAEKSIAYFSKHAIKYLRDTMITVHNQIQIAGREDKQTGFVTGQKRKKIGEILLNVQPNLPLILMDHQPVEYEQAVANSIDLMVSGHTHKGQMWPMNYITKSVFENDYGLYQKGKTWFYTSNGFGTWGPPIRVGNRPEVVIIYLDGKK